MPKDIQLETRQPNALAAAALFLTLGGMAVHGAVIVPGSVLIPAAAEPDPIGGVVVAATGAVPFVIPGSFSGTLTSKVISADPSNPLGGLTFTYSISNDPTSINSIGRLSIQGFLLFPTDASYQVPASGVAPASIDRNVSGDVIGFNFIPTPIDPLAGFLSPGFGSAVLVIQTAAPFWGETTASLIDGGVTTVGALGPAMVPEPQALASLVGVGLLGFGIWRKYGRNEA